MRRRLDDHDLWTGVVLVAVGAAALVLGRDLAIGTAAEMGEGYVPRAMAIALVAFGTLLVGIAWRRDPADPSARLERFRVRPLVFVTGAVLVFAAALQPLGLLAAIAASAVTANCAGRPLSARALALLIAVLSAVVVGLFVWALGLPLNVLPRGGG